MSAASAAELELRGDSEAGLRGRRAQLRWDRKRKRMVHVDPVRLCFYLVSRTEAERITLKHSAPHALFFDTLSVERL